MDTDKNINIAYLFMYLFDGRFTPLYEIFHLHDGGQHYGVKKAGGMAAVIP